MALQICIINDPLEVVSGADFDALSTEEKHRAAEHHHVFARVNPRQKFEILALLQEKNIVGFLGEGFNDAPGLKMANVAIAVEGASDIAREASDVILLDKSLMVIFDGVEEGRKVFTNIVKYLKATLASNFGNFYAVAVASLFIDYLPMLPIQILLVNLLSDFPMLSIATDTVSPEDLQKPKKYRTGEIVLIATVLGIVSTLFDFATFFMFKNSGEQVLQTNWFIVSILTELVFMFTIRTAGPFWKAPPPSFSVSVLTVIAAAATVALPFLPFSERLFHFTAPSANHLFMMATIVIAYFATNEILKRWTIKWKGST